MSVNNIESLKRRDRETLEKWGVDSCREAWKISANGESAIIQSIRSGIPVRSTAPAVRAYRELLRAQSK